MNARRVVPPANESSPSVTATALVVATIVMTAIAM